MLNRTWSTDAVLPQVDEQLGQGWIPVLTRDSLGGHRSKR